jgi:hypothetical protein
MCNYHGFSSENPYAIPLKNIFSAAIVRRQKLLNTEDVKSKVKQL